MVSSPSAVSRKSRNSSGSISSLSRLTWSTAALLRNLSQRNCSTLTQAALDSGKFGTRLIHREDCTHLPTPVNSKHSECQLHKWACKQTQKQVMLCPDCNLTLCVNCYKPFHTVLNANSIKADIESDNTSCVKPSCPQIDEIDIKVTKACRV